MSLAKLWTLRTILVAGAATFALGVSAGPGFAAGHEGSAGMKGGGGAAREMGGTNERFDSIRVESFSPAGFVNRSNAPGSAPRPALTGAPGRGVGSEPGPAGAAAMGPAVGSELRPAGAAAMGPAAGSELRPAGAAAPRSPGVRFAPPGRSHEPRVQPPAQS